MVELTRREFLSGLAGFTAAGILLGCSRPSTPTPVEQAGKPVYGGTVIFGSPADAEILNPILHNDTASSNVTDRIFDPVLRVDPLTGQPAPWLAERWTVSDDGLTYTFYLRRGVRWHDGEEFTAHDVKFTFEAILDPRTRTVRKSNYDMIVGARARIDGKAAETEGIRVVDDYTLEITLQEPFCPFLIQGMVRGVIPRHLLEKSEDINRDEFNRRPVGTGPFKFKEWVKGDHITLVRNEDWWGRPGGPYIDQYIRKVVPDSTVVTAQLKTGDIDVGSIEPSDLDELEREEDLTIYRYDDLGYTYIGYNVSRPPLDDKRVRWALSLAVDTDSIIRTVLRGEGVRVAGHIPPASWAYNPNIKPPEYNPQRARQLLEQAGFKPGPDGIMQRGDQTLRFTLWVPAGQKIREQVAIIAKDQWKQIGVDVDIQFQEWNAFLERLRQGNFDLVISGYSLGVDPNPRAFWHSAELAPRGFNRIRYRNPEVDRLIEETVKVPGCDPEKRKRLYWRFQEILADDQPFNFLYSLKALVAIKRSIVGPNPTTFGGVFHNLHDWYIAK